MSDSYILPDNSVSIVPDDFLEKGWKVLPIDTVPPSAPKSFFEDPFSAIQSYGYKQKRWAPTYRLLKMTVQKVGILSAIINTRQNQVSMFSSPYRRTRTLGYMIKHVDPQYEMTASDQRLVLEMEDYIFNCGRGTKNPFSNRRRDGFREFLCKFVKDRLSIDQASFEINPDSKGLPYEFVAVDGSTIRISSTQRDKTDLFINRRPDLVNIQANKILRDKFDKSISYVQVLDGRIVRTYTEDELAFCPYNLDPDIYTYGYGVPEIEEVIRILTGILTAESYNFNFFHNSSSPKGILVIKSPMDPQMFEAFKREWNAMVKGVENVWKTPILQTDQADWLNLGVSNKDAEYIRWIEYLVRIVCAVFLIDPAEINFDISGQIPAQMNYDTQSEWRIKKSKDRGLRPLLKFIADQINKYIISKIDPRFYLDFVGLDDLTQKERQDLEAQKMALYTTINEGRRKDDLPPLPYGDVPANAIYLQNMQLATSMQMQQQQLVLQKKQLDIQAKQASKPEPKKAEPEKSKA